MPLLPPLLANGISRPQRAPLRWPPLIIGHRGAAGEAPENTLAAFELAMRQGAEGVEFDVHLSADGVPVVIHDHRLDRTTSGSGWVSRLSLLALKRLDAGSWYNRRFPGKARSRYAGLRIPQLSEALAWIREQNCLAFVEIKRGGDVYAGIEAKVLAEIDRAGIAPLTTVISFDLPTLRKLREMDSEISLGIDFTRPLLALRRAREVAAASLLPHWAFASPRFVRRAHEAGLRVYVWPVNRPAAMRNKILDGVDGIVTNYPARLANIRARLEVAGLKSE